VWRDEPGGNDVGGGGVGHSTASFTCLTCKANVVVRELVDCILRGYRSGWWQGKGGMEGWDEGRERREGFDETNETHGAVGHKGSAEGWPTNIAVGDNSSSGISSTPTSPR